MNLPTIKLKIPSISNWIKRRKYAQEMKNWRHKNNIVKSPLELHSNMIYMREYRTRPDWKNHHRKYMQKWRKKQ